MDVIIVLIVSAIGAYFGKEDFSFLCTLISMALSLNRMYTNYTNDKTALQQRDTIKKKPGEIQEQDIIIIIILFM
ncbi:MAG: hypothetical protein J1E64_08885 [Acetatifactor sp.]|nr:hypothetical protein [Acetatifactor sp.]